MRGSNRRLEILIPSIICYQIVPLIFIDDRRMPGAPQPGAGGTPHPASTEIYMSIGSHTLHQFRVICTFFFTADGHTGVSGG